MLQNRYAIHTETNSSFLFKQPKSDCICHYPIYSGHSGKLKSDWFGTKVASVWFQSNRKITNTALFGLIDQEFAISPSARHKSIYSLFRVYIYISLENIFRVYIYHYRICIYISQENIPRYSGDTGEQVEALWGLIHNAARREMFSASCSTWPKSDCVHHAPINYGTRRDSVC